ncbi:MAG TPA: MSMEG_1061 family FMN-dependent PPOX-type flavoprotein [Candidatus Binataceae bacterium]|nr:MSMEG_1061 family FMN-dependent PPOX-type flavoprotein [Candidatus Binataceae bacterium]
MEDQADYRIRTMDQLRALIGDPAQLVYKKLLTDLDDLAIQFIRRSPFLILATSDAEGHLDASPKGDGPGFVLVEDRQTLVIPDRKGNKLLFGLGNIIADPQVGIIFLVPGTGETLRVNGEAELTVEPALLERLTARGNPAQVAIRIKVRECFFHCAKAIMRSQLWSADTWQEKISISWGKYLADKVGAGSDIAAKIDQTVEQDYKTNL